jgi:hypothetical protein
MVPATLIRRHIMRDRIRLRINRRRLSYRIRYNRLRCSHRRRISRRRSHYRHRISANHRIRCSPIQDNRNLSGYTRSRTTDRRRAVTRSCIRFRICVRLEPWLDARRDRRSRASPSLPNHPNNLVNTAARTMPASTTSTKITVLPAPGAVMTPRVSPPGVRPMASLRVAPSRKCRP